MLFRSGLLDKSYNKSQQAHLYDTLDIAKYHQEHEGGHISLLQKISEIHETEDYDYDPLDYEVEG